MKRTFVAAVAVVGFAVAAYAQQSPPPDTAPPPAPPPAAAPSGPPPGGPAPGGRPPAAAVPQANTPVVDCRARAREKGLRGPAVRDEIAICREEQRLACTKEAVERKIVGDARREFIRNCSGRGAGGGRRGGERDDG
jgi:hypothetical protein